ncbi:conserved hypothetical protein [Ricinus communis]|uniref:Uncharacterized protein n=1 Tax=Ricinus communis TaxID=3988 RepID=B9RSQ9_RICCO|nr:conserved hypothetical protein [Ricinus communis]
MVLRDDSGTSITGASSVMNGVFEVRRWGCGITKEKFKMVIGKSKKDEKDLPSKATQPQVGVSVDATAVAAILQAATKGIKNPNLEILWKTLSSTGLGTSSEGGGSLLSSWPQNSNQKPDKNEYKAIAKTAALAVASKADSSEATLTREQKLKAERLRRAKMFAAMIKGGAALVKSESLHGQILRLFILWVEKGKVVQLRWKSILVIKLRTQKRKDWPMNKMNEDQKGVIDLD